MDHTPGAVGSQYHRKLGREICRRMAEGQTIRQIVADPEMPSYATLFHWRKIHPEFATLYDGVRDALAARTLARRIEIETWKPFWRAHRARLGLGRGWVAGQKTTYSLAAAEAVCRRIAGGEPLSWITAGPAMPSAKAIYGWLRREPAFRELYATAVDQRRFHMELAIEGVALAATPATLDAAKRQVARLEGRMGLMAPRVHGRLSRTDRGGADTW